MHEATVSFMGLESVILGTVMLLLPSLCKNIPETYFGCAVVICSLNSMVNNK